MTTARNLFLPVILLIMVVVLSAFGYTVIEGWSFRDSLYMTVITVATVGFKEVKELSPAGQYYTLGVILVGVGVVGFSLSNFTAFLVSGKIRDLLRAEKMQRQISKLKNHFIICGCGRMGYEAVREFLAEKMSIVVVDRDPEVVRKLEEERIVVLRGDATKDDVLRQVGVERARGLLTALPEDADNVYVSLSARGLNPALLIITRGTDESSQSKLLRAGANRVILPYQIGGRRMAAIAVRPEIVDFLDIMMGKDELSMRMEIIRIGEKSKLVGRSLEKSNIREESGGALVMGLIRKSGDLISNPKRETEILAGDRLLVLGQADQIRQLELLAQ